LGKGKACNFDKIATTFAASMEESLRLQRYLSMCGVCSRRKAEAAIMGGEVTVDGVAAKIGQTVLPGKTLVSFRGESVAPPKIKQSTVLAIHKPRGYVCTHGDPHHSSGGTIYALLPMYTHRKLICCGRLDMESEGLVIVTDDGSLAAKLMHPSGMIEKFYAVTVDRPLDEAHRRLLVGGIVDGGELLRVHSVKFSQGRRNLSIVLHCGKKRHIRRMLGALGYGVKKLVRYRIGNFALGDIKPGRHRQLSGNLIAQLCGKGSAAADDGSELSLRGGNFPKTFANGK
jgi:23S rRNA pseudouridine2605 synthase